MKTFKTYSERQTRDLAGKIAKNFTHGVIALTGELGTGKTIFTQGFAKGLGIKEKIISPTYVYIRQHKIPNSKNFLFHIDLYRLNSLKDIKSIGLDELLSDTKNIILIEWAEKVDKFLPKNTTKIYIKKLKNNKRLITIY